MSIVTDGVAEARNLESPLTEIFNCLVQYEDSPNTFLSPNYTSDALKIVQVHVDNAVRVVLHGMQELGRIMSLILSDYQEMIHELKDIGSLFSVLANLVEALNGLRIDADQELKQRAGQY